MIDIDPELASYIDEEILPRYARFDAAHRRDHAERVVGLSLSLARQTGADAAMAYTVAAYHDLGLEGPRECHHTRSGEILAADRRLRQWFSEEQIDTMRQAVEDHRASASHPPRNLYGRIVAEADRDVRPESVCRRTVEFGFTHYPELDREGHWERFVEHLHEKYAPGGYLKLLFDPSPQQPGLDRLHRLIADTGRLRQVFDELFSQLQS